MPVLVLPVSEYFHELFQNCGLTSIAALRKLCRIVVMAVDFAFMLVVAILGTKDSWADRAGEMFNVVLSFKSSDVGAA
jgi:hypothetical protein